MMRRAQVLTGVILLTLLLSGCRDRHNLEDLTVVLILGIDVDRNNNLVFYESSPVFNKEAKDKEEEFGVKASTFHEAREVFDAMVTALSVDGKVQLILLSQRLLQRGDWFPLFDTFYRDAKNSLSPKIVAVDGSVSDIIHFSPKDKPLLPVYITRLIEENHRRNITVSTNLLDLHRQMTDRGMTPFISEIKKDKELQLIGTTLLQKDGKYADSLNLQQTTLLRILQEHKHGEQSLTLSVPVGEKTDFYDQNKLSFIIQHLSTKTKTTYEQGRFRFRTHVNMTISLTERLFPYNMRTEGHQLEQMIQDQMQIQLQTLIKNMQKHKADPVGYGVWARAYQYKAWSEVKNHWHEAWSKADVKVTVGVKIKGSGPIN
ncbi:Ger(x)C family spore germination protein [Paenibacillus sp. RC67]|uniref:Ger(x)C family spore germination protein n=1 Tax=Paenibacillus sp. RC67 TaxID=3039392 RepID=UPI0024AD7107|nr:Ger(x)C family spore germination protein [Paenibacillus sp. RC67]